MILTFFNSAWVRASERLILKGGRRERVRLPVRYGVIRHPRHGAIMIDTGYYRPVLTHPDRGYLLRLYAKALPPDYLDEGQPEAALARFGITPDEVRAVIVTHFHADHISGLDRFNKARIFARVDVWDRVISRGAMANARHGVFAELLPKVDSDKLYHIPDCARVAPANGLPGGWDLFGDGSVLAIDLPGHAEGHLGLLFPHVSPPVFYAVDVQWLKAALLPGAVAAGLASLLTVDGQGAAESIALVRELEAKGVQVILCHDPQPTPFDDWPVT